MSYWTEKDWSDYMANFPPTLKDGRARSIRTAPLKSAPEVGASVPAGLERQRQAHRSGRDSSERRASKFHNVKTEVHGIMFDSAKEARRWQELKLLEKAGEINRLTRQKRFELDVPTHYGDAETIHIATYVCDFDYFDEVTREAVTEDVKGVRTREYKMKRALMQALHGIEIRET